MIEGTIGIIGCGNMGEALLKALARVVDASTGLIVCESDPRRRAYIQEIYKVIPAPDSGYLLQNARLVILAVKPQGLDALLRNEICCGVSREKLLVSIAAGVTTAHIEHIVGIDVPVVRAMPNLPATIGAGVTGICAGAAAGPADLAMARAVLGAVGEVIEVPEELMDAVTAISGSGPAYFFYLVEALIESAVGLGIDAGTARILAVRTALGSAQLLESLGEDPAALRRKVTSKGGTTEAACRVFDEKNFAHIIRDATAAARSRARELTKG